MTRYLLLLMLVGCMTHTEKLVSQSKCPLDVYEMDTTLCAKNVVNNLVYVRDTRTNLCFGFGYVAVDAYANSTGGPILVNVPCQDGM